MLLHAIPLGDRFCMVGQGEVGKFTCTVKTMAMSRLGYRKPPVGTMSADKHEWA